LTSFPIKNIVKLVNQEVAMASSSTGLALQTAHHSPRARKQRKASAPTIATSASVFLTRAINAVVQLQQNLSKQTLDSAATASTDYMVLVKALTAAPVAFEFTPDDPLAAATLRGLERMPQLVAAGGGVVTAEQAAGLLGITRQAVDKRRAQNRLIGLTQGRRGYGYPRFQFVNGTTLPGLEEVLAELGEGDPWGKLLFFANPNDRLKKTPAQELLTGNLEGVLRAARMYGEQGAA
jgi:hypothetical protein